MQWELPPQPLLHAYGGTYRFADNEAVRRYVFRILADASIRTSANPDISFFSFDEMGVADSRTVVRSAMLAPVGSRRVVVIQTRRITKAAQDALLKLFEEPPAKTTLFLFVPEISVLLPTLRSRLFLLPEPPLAVPDEVREFLAADTAGRERFLQRLYKSKDRARAWEFIDALWHAVSEQSLAWKRTHASLLHQLFMAQAQERTDNRFPRQLLETLALLLPEKEAR